MSRDRVSVLGGGRGLVVLLAFVLMGCNSEEDNPYFANAVRDLGAVEFAPSIRGRDGGSSAVFDGHSVWLFGDTMLNVKATDGEQWRTSTFTTTTDLDLSGGLPRFEEPLDENGTPYLFIPYDEEEAAHNRGVDDCQECGHKWVIWPMDVVVDPASGEALVFYMKIKDWENYGTSIARWSDLSAAPERPLVRPGTAEPTLLFQGDDPRLGTAALVEDGYLYAYRCEPRCRLGRVPLAEALDRQAWTFFAGQGQWSGDSGDAVVITRTNHITSVRWNEGLGRYLAVYAKGDAVMMRSAPAPEGPWSAEVKLFEPLAPEGGGQVYDALEHAEFAADGGCTIYVSYSRETGFFLSEMRLVEVRLGGESGCAARGAP